MSERAEAAAKSLIERGYVEVEEIGCLKVGARVRHIGEQYSKAYDEGTGVIEKLFHKPVSSWGKNDIEVIVKRDTPVLGCTHGFWADYHTMPVLKLEL